MSDKREQLLATAKATRQAGTNAPADRRRGEPLMRPWLAAARGKALAARQKAMRGRIEDYAEIRAQGYTIAFAAARLGVSERTAWRYETRLRTQRPREVS